MAGFRGGGLKRPVPVSLRLDDYERDELEVRARVTGISMVAYVRCKTFDKPVEAVGGKAMPKNFDMKKALAALHAARDAKEAKATKATA